MLLGTDGLRAELTLIRAARSLASFEQAAQVQVSHVRRVAAPSLRHRLRRDPLDESGSTARVEKALTEIFGA
jgi:magnesium chelatase subunit I